jgi:hypothetical protein
LKVAERYPDRWVIEVALRHSSVAFGTAGNICRERSVQEFADTMVELGGPMDTRKYSKHQRGPRKNRQKKIRGSDRNSVGIF